MAQDPMSKRPLFAGQFAWAISKKSGSYVVIFGPDPMDATDDELFVVASKDDPTKVIPVDHPTSSIQDFITIKPGEYAVIHNPAENTQSGHPNGPYTKGRNDVKSLLHGSKRVVINGYFPIWPGQKVEIRKIHTLSSNQYLMAEVESLDIDTDAPYYDLTLKCASIKKAVVNETKPLIDDAENNKNNPEKESKEKTSKKETENIQEKEISPSFRLGQRIIIPGNLTPTYIPPSGIEIVIEEKSVTKGIEDSESSISSAERSLQLFWAKGWINANNLTDILSDLDLEWAEDDIIGYLNQHGFNANNLIYILNEELTNSNINNIVNLIQKKRLGITSKLIGVKENNIEKTISAIQQAVVLGPTEFCVLLDEDGKPQVKKGPGRVFPGPYDVFRTEGSRNRVYDAYHLRPDRGILLRIVVDEIKRDDLLNQLPKGSVLEKDLFMKGDEVFIKGFDAYLIPSPAIEVIDPFTRKPHIGNDHDSIYVQAIGVDQKSGIYVADVETGNIKLVRGEKKLILDPRKEKDIHRKVPSKNWDLIIARNEQHKKSEKSVVVTPWALSVIIPNNEAVLVTSKDGRRAEMGPKTILLEYEEWLEIMSLSRGRPKTDLNLLETCFLRVSGNRTSDQIIIETSDYVQVKIDVQYSVEFEGDTPEEQIKWFNYKNYVKYFTYNLRSRLRAAAHRYTLSELYPIMADFVRDIILGKKEEGGHRPGMSFGENNMKVIEVDVLRVEIPDPLVAERFNETNRQIVISELQRALDKVTLDVAVSQNEISKEKTRIQREQIERTQRTDMISLELDHQKRIKSEENNAVIKRKTQSLFEEIASRDRDQKKQTEELTDLIEKAKFQRDEHHKGVIVDIENKSISATAEAEVKKFKAIQPEFIKAIEGLGDKQVLEQLAKSIPAATGELGYLLGSGGINGLIQMLEGSPLVNTVRSLNPPDISTNEE